MFRIYNCFGVIVGRSQGYKTHGQAQAQITRPGNIKTAIWTAYARSRAENPSPGSRLVYKIRFDDLAQETIAISK